MIDTGLAANRRVDLRKQRSRHLNKVHAALVARRSKAGHISNNTATQRNQGGATIMTLGKQRIKHLLQR